MILLCLVMHVCLSVLVCACEYRCLQRPEVESIHIRVRLTGGCEHLMWALRLNSHPLKEQCMLLTAKPPLQPQNSHFEMYTFQQLFRTVQSFAIIDFQNMFTSKGNLTPVHFPL